MQMNITQCPEITLKYLIYKDNFSALKTRFVKCRINFWDETFWLEFRTVCIVIIFITFSHANFCLFCRFLMILWQSKKGKNHRWCWTWINVMLTVPWAILPVMLLPVYFNNLQFYSLYWRLYWCYFENKNPF